MGYAQPKLSSPASVPSLAARDEDLLQRLQRLLGLPETPRLSEWEMAARVERGVPAAAVASLIEHGLSAVEVHDRVLPRRTYSHRLARGEPLSPAESDRAFRVARVLALADRVFGDHERALAWLRHPKTRLDGRTPLAALATEAGARLVEEWLWQIDYGLFA